MLGAKIQTPNDSPEGDEKLDTPKTETGKTETGKGERRFGLGRLMKAPSPEAVARILENRAARKDSAPENAGEAGDGLEQIFEVLVAIHDQIGARDKAFDTLHAELGEYKNDFFYERLKPIARPLLFLLDSMRLYLDEIDASVANGVEITPASVRLNVEHFADQLIEALQIAEMSEIEHETSEFNPKIQRAVEIAPVEADQDGQVLRVVRPGWTIGNQTLRPADVVVGKATG